jgi:hypothetical protein
VARYCLIYYLLIDFSYVLLNIVPRLSRSFSGGGLVGVGLRIGPRPDLVLIGILPSSNYGLFRCLAEVCLRYMVIF